MYVGYALKVRERICEMEMEMEYTATLEFLTLICNIFGFCVTVERIDANLNSLLRIPTNLKQTRVLLAIRQ